MCKQVQVIYRILQQIIHYEVLLPSTSDGIQRSNNGNI